MAGTKLARQPQSVVEAAVDRDHFGAVSDSLSELAGGDTAAGDKHVSLQPAVSGVGGRGSACVPGRGAEDRLVPRLHCLRDRYDHSPVLERTGGVAALELEVKVDAKAGTDMA